MIFSFFMFEKMGGSHDGLNLTGKGVKEKQALLSTQLESGPAIRMIKVWFLSFHFWLYA